MAKNKFTLLQKVLLVLALIMVAFGYQIIWNLMTGAYVEQETCPPSYECTKIPEPQRCWPQDSNNLHLVGTYNESVWIYGMCDGYGGCKVFYENATGIPKCSEAMQ